MKAFQVVRPRVFESVEVDRPRLEGAQILVRTEWVALCGSDIPFWTGSRSRQEYPLAPGAPVHECVGVVEESRSARFCPGDRVLAIPDGNRGLAEWFPARPEKAVVLPDGLGDPGAACLIQPLSTVMSAIDRLGDIRGKAVGIVGLGPMGLLLGWYAAARGAGPVAGVDPCADRCLLAGELGLARTFPSRSVELAAAVRSSGGAWDPPDICIEAVGHQMQTINDCLELVRPYGTVVAFGVPDRPVYALEYEIFFRKNAALVSTVTPDWADYLARARDLYLENTEALAPLAQPRLHVEEVREAYEMYERHDRGALKVVLDARSW